MRRARWRSRPSAGCRLASEVFGERLDAPVRRGRDLAPRKHSEPALTYTSPSSYSPEVMPAQSLAHLLHVVHPRSIMQDIAKRNLQNNAPDGRHNRGVALPFNYRRVLRENLRALLHKQGLTAATLKAKYLDGPKKGAVVSARSVGYMLSKSLDSPGPTFDTIAAVAAKLGVQAHELLDPALDVTRPPAPRSKEAEAQLRHVIRVAGGVRNLLHLLGDLDAIKVDDDSPPENGAVGNASPNSKVPNNGT